MKTYKLWCWNENAEDIHTESFEIQDDEEIDTTVLHNTVLNKGYSFFDYRRIYATDEGYDAIELQVEDIADPVLDVLIGTLTEHIPEIKVSYPSEHSIIIHIPENETKKTMMDRLRR